MEIYKGGASCSSNSYVYGLLLFDFNKMKLRNGIQRVAVSIKKECPSIELAHVKLNDDDKFGHKSALGDCNQRLLIDGKLDLKKEDSNVSNLTKDIKIEQTQIESPSRLNKNSLYDAYGDYCSKSLIIEIKQEDPAKSEILLLKSLVPYNIDYAFKKLYNISVY
jgi:hypothetical protein